MRLNRHHTATRTTSALFATLLISVASIGAASAAEPAPAPAQGGEEAEKRPAKNSIYAEGLGPGLLYSINYDRLIIDDLAVRVGFSYMSFSASAGSSSASASFLSFPITASYLGVGSPKHILELGGGADIVYATGSASGIGASTSGAGVGAAGTVLIGYRLQPPDGGFNFRVGISPLFGPGFGFGGGTSFGVLPWGYLSLGGTF